MKVLIEYDLLIRLHETPYGVRWILILFTDRGEEKFKVNPRLEELLETVEGYAAKNFTERKNNFGTYILVPVDDPDFAVEEAQDLHELLSRSSLEVAIYPVVTPMPLHLFD